MKALNLTNQKFGRLTAIRSNGSRVSPNGRAYSTWICRCECGVETIVRSDNLRNGMVQSCGCSRREFLDLTGDIFSRLTVVRAIGRNKHNQIMWLCRCECGNEATVSTNGLRSGNHRSCGCFQREVASKGGTSRIVHGHNRSNTAAPTPTYVSWMGMIQRCTNTKNPKYPEYGGRGIKVCERWRTFENFLADMGERPEGTTIDRYPNNDGNYESGNCRWATPSQQAANRRPRRKRAA